MNPYQKQTAAKAAKRRAKMRQLKEKGWTLARIGKRFGCSRQRVSVLLKVA
jgi:transcriptional regulator